jgi:hypothetical protein
VLIGLLLSVVLMTATARLLQLRIARLYSMIDCSLVCDRGDDGDGDGYGDGDDCVCGRWCDLLACACACAFAC